MWPFKSKSTHVVEARAVAPAQVNLPAAPPPIIPDTAAQNDAPQSPATAAQTFPVTVKAPIITDGTTQEGVQPLVDFVKAIEAHSNVETARKETERLEPYFSALHIYMTHAIEAVLADPVEPESEAGQLKKTLQGLAAPGHLSGLFNAMAAHRRNTILSDVVIMPQSVHDGPAKGLFPYSETFNPTFKYGRHSFSFGFLQIYEGGNGKNTHSSTTIPTFTLNTDMMKVIEPHQPEKLYRQLQQIITEMNHDMLHHYQSPWLNKGIAKKFDGRGYDRKNPVVQWADSLPGARVEEWSQITHGKIFMTPENAQLADKTSEAVGHFFDELDRIAESLPEKEAHEVIDYFGTVTAQTLSRTFPLNHPLITQCLERMEAADPLSAAELLQSAAGKCGEMVKVSISSPAEVRKIVPQRGSMAGILQGYRQLGCDIFPDDDRDISYKGLKLLQLAALEPDEIRTHLPTPVEPTAAEVRADSDKAFLRLIRATAKITGYQPG